MSRFHQRKAFSIHLPWIEAPILKYISAISHLFRRWTPRTFPWNNFKSLLYLSPLPTCPIMITQWSIVPCWFFYLLLCDLNISLDPYSYKYVSVSSFFVWAGKSRYFMSYAEFCYEMFKMGNCCLALVCCCLWQAQDI